MYCQKCQTEREGRFCGICGTRLIESSDDVDTSTELNGSESAMSQLSKDAKQLAVEVSDKAAVLTNQAIKKGQEAYARLKEKRELQEQEKRMQYEAWVERVEKEKLEQAEADKRKEMERAESFRDQKIQILAAKDKVTLAEQAYKNAQKGFLGDPENINNKTELEIKRVAYVEASMELDELLANKQLDSNNINPMNGVDLESNSKRSADSYTQKTAPAENDGTTSSTGNNVYVYNQSDNGANIVGTWSYFGYSLLFNIPFFGWIFCIFMALGASNPNIKHFARSQFCMVFVLVIAFLVFGASLAAAAF